MSYNKPTYTAHFSERAMEDMREISPEELEQFGWDRIDDIIKTIKDEN